MKTILSPTTNRVQCCAAESNMNQTPLALLAKTRSQKPLRIPLSAISTHLVLRGDRHMLRMLRAAEMAAWQKGVRFV
jgi:hypothetical protein